MNPALREILQEDAWVRATETIEGKVERVWEPKGTPGTPVVTLRLADGKQRTLRIKDYAFSPASAPEPEWGRESVIRWARNKNGNHSPYHLAQYAPMMGVPYEMDHPWLCTCVSRRHTQEFISNLWLLGQIEVLAGPIGGDAK